MKPLLFLFLSLAAALGRPLPSQRSLHTFRSLRRSNTARLAPSRRLVEAGVFRRNPLIFGVETPSDGESLQSEQLTQLSLDMETYKHNVKDLSRLVLGFQDKLAHVRQNFEDRMGMMADVVNNQMLGVNAI